MKSIAFVFDGLGFGGIERIGVDYIRMCIDMGYRVDVYNLNPSANEFAIYLPEGVSYFAYRMSRKGCPETYSYGVQNWWWGKYAYVIISPILTLIQSIRRMTFQRKEYDVSIAISGHINDLSFVARDFIRATKRICWCHGSVLAYLAICDAYSILYRRIDEIVSLTSIGQKDMYAGKRFLYDKQIRKIYNTTYIRDKVPDKMKIDKLRKEYGDYILMIARFERGKGHDTAIKSIRRLKEKGLNKQILFIGDGTLFDDMNKIAVEEGINENCVFLGSCYDVHNYITASYINLLTSRWEGLPTVIIEAMTLGKPCIMTNSDDGEVSHNGQFCKLEEIDDVEGITDSLYELYTDREVYDKYVELSLKRAEDFQPEKIKKEIVSLIEG